MLDTAPSAQGNHNPGVGGSSPSLATTSTAGTNSPNSSIKSMNIVARVGVDVSCVTWIAHTEGAKFWLVQHSFRDARDATSLRSAPPPA